MPRRGNVPKREILPDPVYNSVLVTKLINSIMLDGKKGVAQKVVYGAFEIVEEKTGVPSYYIEADFWDDRDYSPESLKTRIESVCQIIHARKALKDAQEG